MSGTAGHTVPHPQDASWYANLHCLTSRDTRALVACPELLVRKSVVSGIEPETLRSPELSPEASFGGLGGRRLPQGKRKKERKRKKKEKEKKK